MVRGAFEITRENFAARVLQSPLPVLVDFGADWCPPCKMIAPAVSAIAEKYAGSLIVGEVDADDYPEIVQQYGVMGLPTLILFQNGQPVQRITGFQPLERLEAQIAPHVQRQQSQP